MRITTLERETAPPATWPLWRERLLGLERVVPAHVLVLLPILVGGALRFVNLAGVPPGFQQDEGVNGYDAYSLFLTGRDHPGHPFPFADVKSFGDWSSPLLTFLTAPVVGIFSLHVETVRAVSAVIGLLAIPLIYMLGVELFGRRSIGVLAASFIALDPWTVRRHSAGGVVALAIVSSLTIASYPVMKLYVSIENLQVRRGPPHVNLNQLALLYLERNATGRPMYEALGGDTEGQGRILWVRKP